MVEKSVMIRGCENIDVCGTPIGSQVLAPAQHYGAFSEIRRLEYLVYVGGGKNGLRSLRLYQARMVRSQTALGAGFGVRGLSDLLGDRGAPNRLPAVHEGEAREAGVAWTIRATASDSPSLWDGAAGPRRSKTLLKKRTWIGGRSRSWTSSTCRSSYAG